MADTDVVASPRAPRNGFRNDCLRARVPQPAYCLWRARATASLYEARSSGCECADGVSAALHGAVCAAWSGLCPEIWRGARPFPVGRYPDRRHLDPLPWYSRPACGHGYRQYRDRRTQRFDPRLHSPVLCWTPHRRDDGCLRDDDGRRRRHHGSTGRPALSRLRRVLADRACKRGNSGGNRTRGVDPAPRISPQACPCRSRRRGLAVVAETSRQPGAWSPSSVSRASFSMWFSPGCRQSMSKRGVAPATAGLYLAIGIFAVAGGGFFGPMLAGRKQDHRPHMLASIALCIIGLSGVMWTPPETGPVFMVLLGLGMGAGQGIPGILYAKRTASRQHMTQLSGMVQTFGYLIAATGPVITAALHRWSGTWATTLLFLLLLLLLNAVIGLRRRARSPDRSRECMTMKNASTLTETSRTPARPPRHRRRPWLRHHALPCAAGTLPGISDGKPSRSLRQHRHERRPSPARAAVWLADCYRLDPAGAERPAVARRGRRAGNGANGQRGSSPPAPDPPSGARTRHRSAPQYGQITNDDRQRRRSRGKLLQPLSSGPFRGRSSAAQPCSP